MKDSAGGDSESDGASRHPSSRQGTLCVFNLDTSVPGFPVDHSQYFLARVRARWDPAVSEHTQCRSHD